MTAGCRHGSGARFSRKLRDVDKSPVIDKTDCHQDSATLSSVAMGDVRSTRSVPSLPCRRSVPHGEVDEGAGLGAMNSGSLQFSPIVGLAGDQGESG